MNPTTEKLIELLEELKMQKHAGKVRYENGEPQPWIQKRGYNYWVKKLEPIVNEILHDEITGEE